MRATFRPGWLLCLAVAGYSAVLAQEWRGSARATGSVTDLDDQAISGAVVTLRPVDSPHTGPAAVHTDEKGNWGIAGLAPGRWTIAIKAVGFLTSEGWIDVRPPARGSPVRVSLRPLDEVSPILSESPTTFVRWIEKGNDLLEQGRYRDARIEYEKALRVLPPRSRPEVLRSVARTHFLEGDAKETARALERALVLAPADSATRSLYSTVLAQLGRSRQAEEFLEVLARDGAEAAGELAALDEEDEPPSDIAGLASPLPPEIAELAVENPIPGRSGRYRARFAERSPLGDFEELLRRLGLEQAQVDSVDPDGGRYDLRSESYHVYVPESSSPAGYGVLVWVSPGEFGGFVREEIRELLEEHRLIWIGADNAGNRRPRWTRMLLALDAVHNLGEQYEIDGRRVYAAGYSGGGRITSALAMLYGEVFKGGFSLFGCDYFRRVDMPDKPGAYWPPRFPAPDEEIRQRLAKHGRFVLLTGELDFNRAQSKATGQRMLADGFENVLYLTIPGGSHYHAVEKEWLERAVEFLDRTTSPD